MRYLQDGFRVMARFKRQSLAVIIVSSIILGLGLGLNMASRGLENTLLQTSVVPTDGEAYLETRCERNMSTTCMGRLSELIREYRGKIVGKLTQYHVPDMGDVFLMDYEAAAPFLTSSLAEDGLSMLTMAGESVEMSILYTVVGEYPVVSNGDMGLEGLHLSSLITSRIGGAAAKSSILVMDDGEVADFFTKQLGVAMDRVSSITYQIVAFESAMDAKGYVLATFGASTNYSEIVTMDLFSNTAAIVTVFRSVEIVLNIVTVIAILIVIFGVAILVSSVIKATKLTRKAAAASEYCDYVLVMNLLMIIGTIVIAGLVVLALQLIDGDSLAMMLSKFYQLSKVSNVSYWAFSGNCGWILGGLLLLTPVVLLLNYDKLYCNQTVRKTHKAR